MSAICVKSARLALSLVLMAAVGCEPAKQPATKSGSAPATAGIESAPAGPADRLQTQLVEAYKAAHARKDVEAMLALYWFGSADDEMRQTVRENVVAEM